MQESLPEWDERSGCPKGFQSGQFPFTPIKYHRVAACPHCRRYLLQGQRHLCKGMASEKGDVAKHSD